MPVLLLLVASPAFARGGHADPSGLWLWLPFIVAGIYVAIWGRKK